MANQYAKLSVQSNLNRLATLRALEAIQNTGRSLPCQVTAVSGSIVTVAFEANLPYMTPDGTMSTYTLPPLTLPKAESQWLRAPTQVGDFGITVPAETSLGAVSGLGSGVANTSVNYGNMTTLVWVPIASSKFGAAPDQNKAWLNGPKGAVTSDTAQTATHVVAVPTLGTAGTITQTIHNAAGSGATTIVHELDGVNNKITHSLTNALGPVEHVLDGVNSKITHTIQSATGTVQTIVDGAGNAISHVVPTGGLVGLGAVASTLSSVDAAISNSHLSTFQSSLLTQRLNDQIALVGLMHTAGTITSGQLTTILASLVAGFLPGIAVPAGSATVFHKP